MLNYQIEGDGQPLLMIHGFGVSFRVWQYLRPLLRDDFTLIMIELPGIGKSPAPQGGDYLETCVKEIEALRAALKIEQWRVFSYSSGTRVGERYVQRYSERVVNAAFLCPVQTQFYKALGFKIAKRFDSWFPVVGDWFLSDWRLDFLIRFLGFSLEKNPHSREWFEEISSRPIQILKETVRAMPGDGYARMVSPNVPHLFIWGTRDWVTATPRKASARHRLINATHAAPVVEAEQVAELVIPFLSSIALSKS